jgi:uncharacterized protein Smg (DUF494 family)
MKDNLFEILLGLFEKSLTQLRDSHQETQNNDSEELLTDDATPLDSAQMLHVKMADTTSTRVFTYQEQMKMTKASYQFLMRMQLLGIIDKAFFEIIISQLNHSDSHIVTLEETKWTIRNVLAETLSQHQLAFLDLVLYHTEDKHTLH